MMTNAEAQARYRKRQEEKGLRRLSEWIGQAVYGRVGQVFDTFHLPRAAVVEHVLTQGLLSASLKRRILDREWYELSRCFEGQRRERKKG